MDNHTCEICNGTRRGTYTHVYSGKPLALQTLCPHCSEAPAWRYSGPEMETCGMCNGSGEGATEHYRCRFCKGHGAVPVDR